MTEFDRWRQARQEAEQLLQSLAAGPATRPAPTPQLLSTPPWRRHAQAARAALLWLRPGTR